MAVVLATVSLLVLALHFGFSLLAFVSTLLLALVLRSLRLDGSASLGGSEESSVSAGFFAEG